jgi:indolepyruvate ferredoxin oxidoreductase
MPMLRTPYFCSGCPHNTSTRVPEGSVARAGIGCHYMAQWMDRDNQGYTQMGGEGASWIGEAPFSRRRHVFQNIGDGTYFHSGMMAVRAAIASGVNITYKILYNDAVAMTGGQAVDGKLTVPQISRQVMAEGAVQVVVVTDEPEKYPLSAGFAPGTTIRHRDQLDQVQRELREIEGTTVLNYDQTCAAEKRRRRKRGQMIDPPKRVVINEAVCEGCGDCGEASNCVSILPLETEFGRKRQIDQSSCNKDYSCLNGFCPSFVTIEGADPARGEVEAISLDENTVPEPTLPSVDGYGIVVSGVGGTGVVTIGALLGMAPP